MPVFSGVAGQRYGDDRIAIGEPSVSVYQRAAGLRDPDSEFLDCEEVFLISAGIEDDEESGAKGWGGEIRTEHELEIFLKRVEQRIISKGGRMGESMEKVCLESWQSQVSPVLKVLYGLRIGDLKPEALSEAFEQGMSPQEFVKHLGEKHKLFKVREARRLRRPDAPAPDEQEVLFPKEPPADVAPARQRLMPWTETKWLALWYDPATGQNNIDDPDRDYYDTEQEALESADELADAYLGREVQQDYESPEGRVEQAIEYRKSLMRIYAETVEIDVGGPYLLTRSYPAEVGDNVVHWSTVEVGTYPSVAEAVAAGNEWLLQARKTKPEAYFEIKDADDNKVEI